MKQLSNGMGMRFFGGGALGNQLVHHFIVFFICQGRLATLVTEGDLASRDTLQTSFLLEPWAFLVLTQVVRVILVIMATLVIMAILVILVNMSFLDPHSSWVFTNLII